MLQAGRSRDRIPMRLSFFNSHNPSSRTMALGSTQPLTEMSTRNIPGGKGRPARKADNLAAICEPTVNKMWEPQHLTTLWASTVSYRDTFTPYLCRVRWAISDINNIPFEHQIIHGLYWTDANKKQTFPKTSIVRCPNGIFYWNAFGTDADTRSPVVESHHRTYN
jgi:hypothetical protein